MGGEGEIELWFGPDHFCACLRHSQCVCLNRLKAALMRKTGRPEEELCFEERRRSARVGVAEEESIEESCVLERGSRRKAKKEPKHTEVQDLMDCFRAVHVRGLKLYPLPHSQAVLVLNLLH